MPHKLNSIDQLEVIALMDNVSDPFTKSHPDMRWNESQYRAQVLKKDKFCGADFCRACNGLSLLLRFHMNGKTKTIPELFIPRAFDKGAIMRVSYNLTNADLEAHGGKIIETKDPLALFENHFLISGEVPRKTHYELGSPAECRKTGESWEKSPEVVDERILIFNLKNRGLCVFTACGHTGVINATQYAKQITAIDKIHLVMGGFHLAPTEVNDRINPTLEDFARLNPTYIVTGHCTGAKTQAELTARFPEQHISYGVGTVFKF